MDRELNTFASALRELCLRHVLQEKWLLAPSLRVGHQWLEQLTLAGVPVLNLHPVTLQQLGLWLAAPAMEQAGLGLISRQGAEVLAARLLAQVKDREERGYLTRLEPSQGVITTLCRTIRDLRLAGLDADQLARGAAAFEVRDKALELRALLQRWEQALQHEGLIDQAGVLQLARERIVEDPGVISDQTLVVAEQRPWAAALERALWESIPTERRCSLPIDATEPMEGLALQYFRAVGEVNEVREVLRRCAAQGIPYDQVELLHTDSATYVPLVYELMAGLWADALQRDELPVTFVEGLPTRLFRPAQALLGWLQWIEEGLIQTTLVQLIQDGLLQHPEGVPQPLGFTRLADLLRGMGIGLGRGRYLPALDRAIAARQPPEQGREDVTVQGLRWLRQLTADVLQTVPTEGSPAIEVIDGARTFLERHVRVSGRLEQYCRQKLLGELRELQEQLAGGGAVAGLDVWTWLRQLPEQTTVGGEGPRPGRLHVADVLGGGHTGRPYTFVVGLDDGRFPGAGAQDPLLLDHERRRLDSALTTAAGRLSERVEGFQRLLGRLRGQLTLSYSCSGVADDREQFPGSALLRLQQTADGCHRAPTAPASFSPESEQGCIDESEWWTWRFCAASERVAQPTALIDRCYAHLGRGRYAREMRAGDAFTAYDGHVPQAGRDHDPGSPDGLVLSATALETMGRCPQEFFFKYLLKIEAPTELTLDSVSWLDALQRGSLLHGVFYEFMLELQPAGRRPSVARDGERLRGILNRAVVAQRNRTPPPTEEAFRREVQLLEQCVRIFLREEERYGAHAVPRYFEVAVGSPPEGQGGPLDRPEPLTLRLPGGQQVRVKGKIDRLDQLEAEAPRFVVWDYKTGSGTRYSEQDPFKQGRYVQSALYLPLAEQLLRQAVSPAATVQGFGYFFPSPREYGRRISWRADQLVDGMGLIERLCQLIRAGAFLFTDDPGDVRYSDYRPLWDDLQDWAAASKRKLAREDNLALRPLAELRGYREP